MPVWKGGSEALEIVFILQAKMKKEISGGIVLVKKTDLPNAQFLCHSLKILL